MQEGAADYLLKGQFDAPLLERAVRYAIERRRAEEELELRVREREMLFKRLSVEQSRLQAVIANAASGIVVADPEGRVVLANPIAEHLLGSALLYDQPLDLLAVSAVGSNNTGFLARAAQHGETCENLELVIEASGAALLASSPNPQPAAPAGRRSLTAGRRYLLASATPIRDVHGRNSGAVGVFQDITARKEAEENLRRQAARAQLLAVISKAFAEAGLNDQAVLDTITREIARELADACIIRLTSPDKKWLLPASAASRNPNLSSQLHAAVNTMQVRSDVGLAGHVLRTASPVLLAGFTPEAFVKAVPHEFEGWLKMYPIHSLLLVPLRIKERPFGVLILMRLEIEELFTLEDLHFFEDLAGRASLAIENARLYEEVQKLSITDPLTGLYNRRGMLSLSESELGRAMRLHQQVTVVLVDIDLFKVVNDTYGHPVGDEVLQAVAGRLRASLRNQDVLARYGGEEFAILLPECCPVMGATIAERLRRLFENHPVHTHSGSVNITVSLGMVVAEPASSNLGDLLLFADQALYRAKQGGRNRVEVYE
jgi:diguanylate cyclase (GGDEF)-like protein